MPNNRLSKYVKQKLVELTGEIGSSTIVVRAFNTVNNINDITTRYK